MRRFLKILGWLFLWFGFFWTFLVIGFPAEAAKGWLTDRLEKGLNARVSIEELRLRWDLGIRLKGISVIRGQGSGARGQEHPLPQGEGGFTIKIGSFTANPRLLSLIRLKPEIDFYGGTPSGGDLSGSYGTEELSLSFKDISFKDISIAALPVPSAASVSGSGKLKLIKGKGMIEIEFDGIPGGKQRAKAPGGDGPGLDGKLKITVSMPGLNLPQ